MFASFVFYIALFVADLGALSVIRPLRFIGIRTRRRGAAIFAVGVMVAVVVLVWPSHEKRAATRASHLDEFMPVWQFDERHASHVAASPAKVFSAIRAVRARDILFFLTLTTIRRMGRPTPPSIVNAPENEPLLDLVTRTSFIYLADDPPHELVVGTVIAAPRNLPRGAHLTPEAFRRTLRPGFVLATMNFLVTPDGRGGSNVSTETRVYANSDRSRRLFTIYWRIIHPGSDIIRRMWLRAIKLRAEG
jgi:hypothetical protein